MTWALLLVGWGVACAHEQPPLNPVVGVITPEYFRFRDIVAPPDDPDDTGGWRAVCIHAQINQGNSRAKTICKFEVGVPIRARDHEESPKEIPATEAQFASASMANRAVRDVLSKAHPGEMMAVLCNRFKEIYRLMLKAKIPAANVGECTTKGTEVVLFGITAEPEPTP
jgi:hypothetical protein